MIRLAAIHLLSILASSGSAQQWTSSGEDDGYWFSGIAAPASYSFALSCGGRSAQERPLTDDSPAPPFLTLRNTIAISIGDHLVGTDPELSGLRLSIDGQIFDVPVLRMNPNTGIGRGIYDIDDPVFSALRAGSNVALLQNETTLTTETLSGSSDAIRLMAQTCVAGWNAQPRTLTSWNTQTVIEVAQGFCNGPAKVDMQYITIQDLDGDNIQDLLLDIGAVECTNQEFPMSRGAGMCGAANCSQFVYLSTAPTDEPDVFLSIGSRVRPGPDGRPIIAGGAGISQCQNVDLDGCESWFDPSSGTLEYLGLFSSVTP